MLLQTVRDTCSPIPRPISGNEVMKGNFYQLGVTLYIVDFFLLSHIVL